MQVGVAGLAFACIPAESSASPKRVSTPIRFVSGATLHCLWTGALDWEGLLDTSEIVTFLDPLICSMNYYCDQIIKAHINGQWEQIVGRFGCLLLRNQKVSATRSFSAHCQIAYSKLHSTIHHAVCTLSRLDLQCIHYSWPLYSTASGMKKGIDSSQIESVSSCLFHHSHP